MIESKQIMVTNIEAGQNNK
ncbi:hypothetical protein CGSSp9BS68_11220 [Streptococcus pneumoniae SP9-BS68]|nr:hypothetical protein CGSSp9BS68_11220 [Streptococcus pneumoniae SP9-BS68]